MKRSLQAKDSGLTEIRRDCDARSRALGAPGAASSKRHWCFSTRRLKYVRNQMARDRVLNDLGASFIQLGVYTAARDAFLVVAATAQEQYMRWTATINLLDVAVHERREPLFEQYRRDLEDATLPPTLAAYYYMYVAQGHRAFDQLSLATAAIRRRSSIAMRQSAWPGTLRSRRDSRTS